jgi:hypothetical protein
MKTLIFASILHFALTQAAWSAPSFFCFVNAIDSGYPTVLRVNGKTIGDAFQSGFVTGGMGFDGSSVKIDITNGESKVDGITVAISPQTSPIVIAYLSSKEKTSTDSIPQVPSIKTIEIPVSPQQGNAGARAIYVGEQSKIDILLEKSSQGEKLSQEASSPHTGQTFTLVKDEPSAISSLKPGTRVFIGERQVGVFDMEGDDNWLLVFFDSHKANDGGLQMTVVPYIIYR